MSSRGHDTIPNFLLVSQIQNDCKHSVVGLADIVHSFCSDINQLNTFDIRISIFSIQISFISYSTLEPHVTNTELVVIKNDD